MSIRSGIKTTRTYEPKKVSKWKLCEKCGVECSWREIIACVGMCYLCHEEYIRKQNKKYDVD